MGVHRRRRLELNIGIVGGLIFFVCVYEVVRDSRSTHSGIHQFPHETRYRGVIVKLIRILRNLFRQREK